MIGWLIAGAVVVIIAMWVAGSYNSIVKEKLKVDNQWSQVNVQLKMRADLIPNLVETVSGYARHEKDTLQSVIEARNRYVTAPNQEEAMRASGELSGLVSRLFALSESYPELKANTNFTNLQNQLSSIEEKIANYRQFYNDTVMRYNTAITLFPKNIIASILGFKEMAFFQIDESERSAPTVRFN